MFFIDRIKYRHKRIEVANIKFKIKDIYSERLDNSREAMNEYTIKVINNINRKENIISQTIAEGMDIDLLLKNGILEKTKVVIAKEHNEELKRRHIYKDVY